MTLFRPVGPRELQKIVAADWRAFPPRRPEQPIFYPVLNFEYAWMIAHDWNAPSPDVGYAGYVVEFDIDPTYVSQFEVHVAGGEICQELWIPAEGLDVFNRHIVGRIRLLAACFGDGFPGAPLPADHVDLEAWVAANPAVVAINLPWWGQTHDVTHLADAWDRLFPDVPLPMAPGAPPR